MTELGIGNWGVPDLSAVSGIHWQTVYDTIPKTVIFFRLRVQPVLPNSDRYHNVNMTEALNGLTIYVMIETGATFL